tara:strand:+ start:2547 stop:2948 length:402 start_codon:yes stop_codon:yes gene_type:complete
MDKWSCYLIENKGYTYCGVSNDVHRRLKCHNGELAGGAKYTTSKGPGWSHICIVHGFQNKIQSMQFEWAVKHVPPRNAGGVTNRVKKLICVLNKEKWTSKSCPALDIPLTIEWINSNYRPESIVLPNYIQENI